MNKVLSMVAAIAFAAVGANAAQDGAAYSSKAWLGATQAPAAKMAVSVSTSQRMCANCRVPVKVQEQTATKPGHGTVQATAFVDQCPGCGAKIATELKQTEYIHICTRHCCGA